MNPWSTSEGVDEGEAGRWRKSVEGSGQRERERKRRKRHEVFPRGRRKVQVTKVLPLAAGPW